MMVAAFVLPRSLRAQRSDSSRQRDSTTRNGDARDSAFLRARKLVMEGNGSVGRALVDSLLKATEGTPAYADALYWRGALAGMAADAERDYRRVIVEYPFSVHASDALLALAQLEMARGERGPAIDHLQRFLLQYPNNPDRARASVWLGRLLLEQNQLARGCAMLMRTRATLGAGGVELRNQIDYYATRCVRVDTSALRSTHIAVARTPRSTERATDSTRPDSAARSTPRAEAPPEPAVDSKRYTVQVAAYDTKDGAEELALRLGARGIPARVVAGPPLVFRVRVGRYASEAEATEVARDLKAKGITGFVTTTENERATAPTLPPVRP